MTHTQRVTDVALAYGRPESDVANWPIGVVLAFWRNAVARGYLIPSAA